MFVALATLPCWYPIAWDPAMGIILIEMETDSFVSSLSERSSDFGFNATIMPFLSNHRYLCNPHYITVA